MKILFAIQGTGNGHISRAREVLPALMKYGEVELLVSGTQSDVRLPYTLKYKLHGLSYTFGKKGGIDFLDSFRTLNTRKLIKDIFQLPVEKYDLVFNDFEPVSAWACKMKGKPCVAISHQAAFLSEKTPRPEKKDFFAEGILRHYAPVSHAIGFHYEKYDDFIHTPVIRKEVRELSPADHGHITVYLPAYEDTLLIRHFSRLPDIKWEVFSKHSKTAYTQGNVRISPIENRSYISSLENCHGLITGGGFEAPAEAIFLNKKLLIIPMTGQYEQHCNAIGAERAGCTVVKKIDAFFKTSLQQWLRQGKAIHLDYPDETEDILEHFFDTTFRQPEFLR
jgi:uncharacterized protein (TIGR00661 family)